jgi:hypothetical protein
MELHVVIEKRHILHIERYLANCCIPLRASSGRSHQYCYACCIVAGWSVLKRTYAHVNMCRPGLAPDGLNRLRQNFRPILCCNDDSCFNCFHPFCRFSPKTAAVGRCAVVGRGKMVGRGSVRAEGGARRPCPSVASRAAARAKPRPTNLASSYQRL